MDDRGYGPWKPDAISLEVGVSLQVAEVAYYSAGVGIITSVQETAPFVTVSSGYNLNLKELLKLKNLKTLRFGPYFSFNMYQNKTITPLSLNVYKQGGLQTSVGLGGFSLNYGRSAVINGPNGIVDITNQYNSYGFSVTSGVGISATPTYTWIFK